MPDEIIYMRLAIEEAGIPAKAHRGEMGNGEHAEFVALERKPNNQVIAGATVYTTLSLVINAIPPRLPALLAFRSVASNVLSSE